MTLSPLDIPTPTGPRITINRENNTVTFEPGYYKFTKRTVFSAAPGMVITGVSIGCGGTMDVKVESSCGGSLDPRPGR